MAKSTGELTKISLKSTIAEIESLRKALSQCAEGSEQYKKNMEELSKAEKQWEQEFKKASDTIKNSNATYKETATAMSDLKKAWKETSDEATRNSIGKAIGEANQKLKDLDASIGNYQRNVGQYENATKSLKTQLKELKSEMQQLEIAGLGGSDAYREMQRQAGALSDAMSKVGSDINNAANDVRGISNAVTIFGDGVAVFGAYQSAMALFGKESKDVEKALQKLVAVQTLLNSVNQIAKALGDDSSVTYKFFRGILEGLGVVKEKEVATSIRNTTAKGAETAALEVQNGVIAQNTKELIANDAARNGNIKSGKGLNKIVDTIKNTFKSGTGSILGYAAGLTVMVGGTIAAAVGLRKLIEYFKREHNPALKDAYEAEQRLNELRERASGKIVDNMVKLATYTTTLKTAESGTTAYKNAEKGLIDMADSFDAAIIRKKNGVIDLAATYDNLAKAIKNAAIQEAVFEKNKEIMKDIIDLETERKEKQDKYDKELKSGSSHFTGGVIAGTGSQFGFIGNTGTMTTVKDADVTKQQIATLNSEIAKKNKEMEQNIATAQKLFENVEPSTKTGGTHTPTKTGGGNPTKTTTEIDNLKEFGEEQEKRYDKLDKRLEELRHKYAMMSSDELKQYDTIYDRLYDEYNLKQQFYNDELNYIDEQLERTELSEKEREKLLQQSSDIEKKQAKETNVFLEELKKADFQNEKDINKERIKENKQTAEEYRKTASKTIDEINAKRDSTIKEYQDKEQDTDFWGRSKDYTEEIKQAEKDAITDIYNARQKEIQQEIDDNERLMESLSPLSDEYETLADAVRDLKRAQEENTTQFNKDIAVVNAKEPKQFKKRKATYQDYARAATSLIDAVSDAEKASLDRKVKNGEISEEQAKKEFERIKKMQIASAIIQTIAGAVGAYMADTQTYKPASVGIAMGVVDAATTLAAGYAQINQIKSTDYGSSSVGGGGGITYVPRTAPLLNEQLDSNSLQNISVHRLGNIEDNQQDTRVYIQQRDITNSNKQVEVRQRQSTF